jgi:hypothetical protein
LGLTARMTLRMLWRKWGWKQVHVLKQG